MSAMPLPATTGTVPAVGQPDGAGQFRHRAAAIGRRLNIDLVQPIVEVVRNRQFDRLWFGPAAALTVAALALAFRTRGGHAFIDRFAITHPGEALHRSMIKIPLSLLAPAEMLPFGFAMLQTCLVFSLAQVLLGSRTTLLVGLGSHALATMSAHLWIAIGPGIGVGHHYDTFRDAGPSVAVIALLVYIAVDRNLGWLAATILAYHAVEIGIFNGLSQREHLVGSLTGAVAAMVVVWRRRRRAAAVDAMAVPLG